MSTNKKYGPYGPFYQKYEPPKTIEEARNTASLPAFIAAPLWGWIPEQLVRFLCRNKPKGAIKRNKAWFVTPDLMDKLLDQKFFDNVVKQGKKNLLA